MAHGGHALDGDDVVLNFTYFLYVVAPLVKDELWLRVLLMCSSCGFALWAVLIENNYTLVWNLLFLLVSLRSIYRIVTERRPHVLSEAQERVRSRLFPEMSGRDFQKFWDLGEDHHAVGEQLTVLGEPVNDFWVFVDGEIYVDLSHGRVNLKPVDTIGGVSYIMGEQELATASVFAVNAHLRVWGKVRLRALAHTHPELNAPFLSGLGRGLANKMQH